MSRNIYGKRHLRQLDAQNLVSDSISEFISLVVIITSGSKVTFTSDFLPRFARASEPIQNLLYGICILEQE